MPEKFLSALALFSRVSHADYPSDLDVDLHQRIQATHPHAADIFPSEVQVVEILRSRRSGSKRFITNLNANHLFKFQKPILTHKHSSIYTTFTSFKHFKETYFTASIQQNNKPSPSHLKQCMEYMCSTSECPRGRGQISKTGVFILPKER